MLNQKLKKTTAAVLLAMSYITLCSNVAHAGVEKDMADMFNNMGGYTSYTEPGAYQSQSANVYTGGGFKTRFGNKNLYPVQIQLPSVSAGCGGIDFFSGAFSFANKEQFVEFTRNLGNNAAGVAFEIALDALDPLVAGSIGKIREMVNFINQNGLNSCQAAKSLVGGMAGKLGESITKECELTATADGTSSDGADSRWYCKSGKRLTDQRTKKRSEGSALVNAMTPFFDANGAELPKGTGAVNKTSMALTGGNLTLMALNKSQLDEEQRLWLISIIGAHIATPPPKNDQDEQDPKIRYVPPTIQGYSKGTTKDSLFESFYGNKNDKIEVTLLSCHEPGGTSSDPYKATECTPEKRTYTGFRKRTADLVEAFKNSIKTNQKLDSATQGQVIKLINNSSLPMLKMAIVDASSGGAFLSDKAIDALSMDMTQTYVNELIAGAELALGSYDAKDEAEDAFLKNGRDQLLELAKAVQQKSSDAKLRLSNETNFSDYVRNVNNSLSKTNPNLTGSLGLSKLLGWNQK